MTTSTTTNFVTIRNGSVLLWQHGWNSPRATIAHDATMAVVYEDEIVVTFKNGTSTLYQITNSGTSAYPVRSL